MKLVARGRELRWPRRSVIMGIVNLSVDSFSGDGVGSCEEALDRARGMILEGAEVIDIGAESARTNRVAISEAEEIGHLTRFVDGWESMIEGVGMSERPWLSVNTWRPGVVREVLAVGGDILNDIGGLPTGENAESCARHGVALLIMHSVGEPKVAHTGVRYADVMGELRRFFVEKVAMAEGAGMRRDSLILDPGIDFAKQREDNLRIYRWLDELREFARPILLPVSRKTVIGEVLGLPVASERDAGTVACIVQGMLKGGAIFRVHNVRAAVQAVRMIEAVEGVE